MSLRAYPFLLAGVSVLTSVVLWLTVQSQDEPVTQRELAVRLELRNLASGFIVGRAPSTVPVVAEGTKEQLTKIEADQITAFIDLSEPKVGNLAYRVQLSAPTRLPVAVNLIRNAERIDIVRLGQDKRAVEVEAYGKIQPGLLYDGAVCDPSSITVIGPEHLVQKIRKVRVLLDLSKLQPGGNYAGSPEVIGQDNRPLRLMRTEPQVVTILPSVAAAPESKSVLVVPKWKGQPAFGFEVAGFEIRPNQVELSGRSSALAMVARLETEPIDLSGLKTNTTLRAIVRIPSGVRARGSTSVRVFVQIVPSSNRPSSPPPNQP